MSSCGGACKATGTSCGTDCQLKPTYAPGRALPQGLPAQYKPWERASNNATYRSNPQQLTPAQLLVRMQVRCVQWLLAAAAQRAMWVSNVIFGTPLNVKVVITPAQLNTINTVVGLVQAECCRQWNALSPSDQVYMVGPFAGYGGNSVEAATPQMRSRLASFLNAINAQCSNGRALSAYPGFGQSSAVPPGRGAGARAAPRRPGRDVDSSMLTDAQINAAYAAADATAGGGAGSATQDQIDAALIAQGARPYTTAQLGAQSGAALAATGGGSGEVASTTDASGNQVYVSPTFATTPGTSTAGAGTTPRATTTGSGVTGAGAATVVTAAGNAVGALIPVVANAAKSTPSTTATVTPSTAASAAVTMPALSTNAKIGIGVAAGLVIVGGIVAAVVFGGKKR